MVNVRSAADELDFTRSRSIRGALMTALALAIVPGTLRPDTVAADPLFAAGADFGTGNGPKSVAIGDLNGDGTPDLVTANRWASTVSVLLGNGGGSFEPKSDYDTGATPLAVAVADLNGDGTLDLATANNLANTVSVLLGSGDGTFGAKTDFATANYPNSVAIGDLNGDGKPDLVTTNFEGTNQDIGPRPVSVLLGNGDGTFGARTDFGSFYPRSVAIGDLNGDARPDLVTADVAAEVSVLLGNGDGTFGAPTHFATGHSHYSVAIGDLDGDGRLDLVTAANGVHAVSVLLGNGDGTFRAHTDFGTGVLPNSVAIGDLDGDGKPDLVTANGSLPWVPVNTVSVLLGNGDGTFGAHTDYGTGWGPSSVAIGDLNSDGKLDLATANVGANTVSVLLNIGPPRCPIAPMSVALTPNALNLRSMGHWVTGVLEPEPPASPADIDVVSIRLNGSVPVETSAPTSIGDVDNDGRPDLTVKFDRAAVEMTVEEGEAVTVTVTGEIGSHCFEASAVIRVVRAHVSAPSAGSVLACGSTTVVRWDTPTSVPILSVALLWSSDNGANWTLVARDLPNTGSCPWTAPDTGTDRARLAVVLVESADESGFEVSAVLGVSERFVITTPLGVSEPRLELALQALAPNPSRNLRVSFALPDAYPATLVAYDVSGREVGRREVGGLGAGRHVLTLGASQPLAPGYYLVQLIRGDRRLVARGVVVR